ncbi:hypothetical protein G6F31_021027 [Rhizopus arrhizus]|nr:hypothetical protein G6F31_021027 [Rhizopus arrhizus]
MARHFENLKVKSWLHAPLTVKKATIDVYGLHGSGMFLINPPWTLHEGLKQAMPYLARELGQDERAGFTLQYRFGGATYAVTATRVAAAAGPLLVTLDGVNQEDGMVRLRDDGQVRQVRIELPGGP